MLEILSNIPAYLGGIFAAVSVLCAALTSGVLALMMAEKMQSVRESERRKQRLMERSEGSEGSALASSATRDTDIARTVYRNADSSTDTKKKTPFWERPLFVQTDAEITQGHLYGAPNTALCLMLSRSELGKKLLHLMKQAGFERQKEAYLQWWLVAAGFIFVLAFVFASLLLAGTALILLTAASLAYLQAIADRRKQALRAALPDMLDELAQSLRAGRSFPQSVSFVLGAQQEDSPLVDLLKRLDADLRLGRNSAQSLLYLSKTTELRELKSIAAVLEIASRVGGSTSTLFEQIATSIRQDLMLNEKLKVQTAQGKSSVRLVGAIPFALIALMSLMMPGYLGLWLTSRGGQFLFALAMCLVAGGFFWVRSVVDIRV